jgi:hypothetical protein
MKRLRQLLEQEAEKLGFKFVDEVSDLQWGCDGCVFDAFKCSEVRPKQLSGCGEAKIIYVDSKVNKNENNRL